MEVTWAATTSNKDASLAFLAGMDKEISSGSNEDCDEIDIETEIEDTKNVEVEIEDPKVGMTFKSIDEIYEYYSRYGKRNGFAVSKKYCKRRDDGEKRYVTIACTRAGKAKIRTSNIVKLRPQTKTGCKAGLNANLQGIRMNKNFTSLVLEAGGHEKLSYLEKDCRNHMDKVRRLKLEKGDATAMYDYFVNMQADNSEFFYVLDLDEDGKLLNVFWADARSRAAFKEFGDVVTFDTTYLVNKYDMPFAPFIGVNHHGQSTLLGCGLISHENIETFTWLFKSWLACISGCPPNAIITDQDKAMKKAIQIVFPNVRHRWCLWHILKKLPEKLRGYKEYKAIKFGIQNAVYNSLTKKEFEENWNKLIENYQLEGNEWLFGLFEDRHQWVPAFVKDIFWAGMSTTQRSESMHAFFDRYINSKTTLKQFVEQYENALAKKVENENGEEFNSLNSYIPCIAQYPFEKQFQKAYTIAKFKEFQQEVAGQLHCNLSLYTQGPDFSVYEVSEDVPFGENLRLGTFIVYFDKENFDTNCSCRLFEFRGIVCRHQIVVLMKERVHEISDKYILRRWNKNVKRCHSKVIINYNNSSMLPETRRYNKMFNVFNDVADLATDCENRCDMVVEQLLELKGKLKEEVEIDYGNNKSSFVSNHHNSTTHGDGVSKSKESRIILDPVALRQKGRPPCKRKQSMVEKQSEFGASSNIGLVDLGTQESIQVNESEILGPSLQQQNIFQENLSYQLRNTLGHHHPSPSLIFEHSSFTKMLNDIVQS
ncbi:protein FAR1-RELATED SEQUENCE 6-like [Camellia sinensis]|uniref:protein FAR1-RELATED SEQUENCE 6-like n=1 Tax=Camellia sinensis TaxID=4442 RepID=UPI001036282C|nr:protein FAR1-RELATED SEQUENCE 6-like [Camellia sinensis]